jgi:hypothetical protein
MDSIGFFCNSFENHVNLSNAVTDLAEAQSLLQGRDFSEFSEKELRSAIIHCEKILDLAHCYPGVGLA